MPFRRLHQLKVGVRRRLIAFLESRSPEGYEDETGFHFGPKPVPAAAVGDPRQVLRDPKDTPPAPFESSQPVGSARREPIRPHPSPDLRLLPWDGCQQTFDFHPRN